MADGFTPVFSPAGTGHRAGAVPDPGQDTPPGYVLRADGTWGAAAASSWESGNNLLTITAGNPAATGAVIFGDTFGAPPLMFVSSDNPELMPSVASVGTTSAVIELMAATPVVTDATGNCNWLAVG